MTHDPTCCIFDREVKFCCCIDNELTQDQIDDLIDEWHQSELHVPLHAYLSMTWDQYQTWVAGR